MQGNFTPSQRDQANFAPSVSIAYHTYALLRNAMHATRLHARSRGKKISFHEEGNTKKKKTDKNLLFLFTIYTTSLKKKKKKKRKIETRRVIDRDECGGKLWRASKFAIVVCAIKFYSSASFLRDVSCIIFDFGKVNCRGGVFSPVSFFFSSSRGCAESLIKGESNSGRISTLIENSWIEGRFMRRVPSRTSPRRWSAPLVWKLSM